MGMRIDGDSLLEPALFGDNSAMDESEFRRSMHFGLGRAILYAHEHDVRAFRNSTLDACLNCYAFDPQCEGTRADFMLDLIKGLPDYDFYCDGVLNALPNSGDDWHAKQRFRIASCLAQLGDKQAKHLMYESFLPGPNMGSGIAIEFINLDGMAGFLFAVEKLGKLLLDNRKGVDLGWLMSVATEHFGEQRVLDGLREEAVRSPRVRAFLSTVEVLNAKTDRVFNKSLDLHESYDQIKATFPMKYPMRLRFWGKRATDSDFLQAAHGLRTATDTDMQTSHLAIFGMRRFPLDHSILFELAKSPNERTKWAALKALAQIADPAVRSLAFELVQKRAKWRSVAIDIMCQNFQPGDHCIVLNWFEAEDELETLHRETQSLFAFWENHPSEGSYTQMLCSVYEKCPCSFCREKSVRMLLERNALPADLRAECVWDANSEIREIINI